MTWHFFRDHSSTPHRKIEKISSSRKQIVLNFFVSYIPTLYRYNTPTEQPFANDNVTEAEAEQINDGNNKSNNKEKLTEGVEDSFTQQGIYYIYHPTGLLQKIAYSTKSDVENMGYTAQLKYQDVEPIKEPIYTYDPNTYAVQQIQV